MAHGPGGHIVTLVAVENRPATATTKAFPFVTARIQPIIRRK